ncbi:hypothetical protein [Candidatus Xenohaliotis californiensis]
MSRIKITLIFLIFFIIPFFVWANEFTEKNHKIMLEIKKNILALDNIVIDFYQYDQQNNGTIGRIFVKQQKIRVDYQNPRTILIIKGNRLIYHDLELDQITTFANSEVVKLNFFSNLRKNIENLSINTENFKNIEAVVPLEEKTVKLILDGEQAYLIKKIIINDNNSNDITLLVNMISSGNIIDDKMFSTYRQIKKVGRF